MGATACRSRIAKTSAARGRKPCGSFLKESANTATSRPRFSFDGTCTQSVLYSVLYGAARCTGKLGLLLSFRAQVPPEPQSANSAPFSNYTAEHRPESQDSDCSILNLNLGSSLKKDRHELSGVQCLQQLPGGPQGSLVLIGKILHTCYFLHLLPASASCPDAPAAAYAACDNNHIRPRSCNQTPDHSAADNITTSVEESNCLELRKERTVYALQLWRRSSCNAVKELRSICTLVSDSMQTQKLGAHEDAEESQNAFAICGSSEASSTRNQMQSGARSQI